MKEMCRRIVGMDAILVGLAALAAPAAPASAAATVTAWTLVQTVRVSLTTYDYTYKITVANTTPGLTGAVATVTSTVPSTVVLKGSVSLGTLGLSSTTISSDTFQIQVDRTVAFDPSKIIFSFSGTPFLLVPNVVGLTQAAATTAITGAGLTLGTVGTSSSSTVPTGNVISQLPLSGASAAPASAVNIVVSTGPAPVTVPNVVGLTQTAATTAITGAGLTLGTVGTASSATVPAGKIISQLPLSGTSAAPASAVNIVVSTGPAPVTVPNVVGLTQAAATTAITGAGLTVGVVTTQNSATVPAGNVISQAPVGGTSVSAGTSVNITVSLGAGGASPAALQLKLSQLVVGAGDSLSFTAVVLDGGGNPIASPPSIDYQILWSAGTSTGGLPGVNGNQIVSVSNTRGSFQLNGTVHGTAVTATIGFTVLQNSTQSGNAALYTVQSLAQAQVQQKIQAILDAVNAGTPAVIPALNVALTSAAATVDPEQIGFGTAYEPDVGFIPSAAQLASHFSPTAADGNFTTLAANLRAKVQQITALLTNPPGPAATDNALLATYVADLATLQAQVLQAGSTPSPYGLANNALAVDGLLGKDMPALLRAIASRTSTELASSGLASNRGGPSTLYRSIEEGDAARLASWRTPAGMYASQQPSQFLLTGMLGSFGAIGNLIQKIYGPFLDQLQKMAILLAAQGLLNAYIDNYPIVGGMITGASVSFQVYHAGNSVIYLGGVTLAQAQAAEVYLVGGSQVDALNTAANAVGGIKGVKTISDLFKFLKSLYGAIKTVVGSVAQAHQQPDSYIATSFNDGGCLLSSVDPCVEMYYNSGFGYVGSGGPIHIEPVIVLIRIPDPTSAGYGSSIFNFSGT